MLDLVRPTYKPISEYLRLQDKQAPAGDVPIRSVTIAGDGTCLVAGNDKVHGVKISSRRNGYS